MSMWTWSRNQARSKETTSLFEENTFFSHVYRFKLFDKRDVFHNSNNDTENEIYCIYCKIRKMSVLIFYCLHWSPEQMEYQTNIRFSGYWKPMNIFVDVFLFLFFGWLFSLLVLQFTKHNLFKLVLFVLIKKKLWI